MKTTIKFLTTALLNSIAIWCLISIGFLIGRCYSFSETMLPEMGIGSFFELIFQYGANGYIYLVVVMMFILGPGEALIDFYVDRKKLNKATTPTP